MFCVSEIESGYMQLSKDEKEKYKRCARLRHAARSIGLSVHKLFKQDRYYIFDNHGYTRSCNLEEAETLLKSLNRQARINKAVRSIDNDDDSKD